VLAREFGYELVPQGFDLPKHNLREIAAELTSESAEVVKQILVDCLDADGVNPNDHAAITKELDALQRDLIEARAVVDAAAANYQSEVA